MTSAGTSPTRYRLAIVASHVVQYQVPLYRALAAHPQIDLTVLFCSRAGATNYFDREFQQTVRWDRPMLEGYRHEFLRNLSRAAPGRPWSAVNPGLPLALARGRFDAVVVPGYAVVSYWLAYLAALVTRTPVLFRGEVVLRPKRRWPIEQIKTLAIRSMLCGTSACLTIGSHSREFYLRYGVLPDHLFSTPYTVDNDYFVAEVDRWRFRRTEVREGLGLPADVPVVLFVGKLVERKRPADLLNALAGLDPPASVLFVGDGPQRGELERLGRDLGVRAVVFAGFRNQSELPQLYAAADLFALPSSHEVSPLVLNEAMCAGLGLVVSDAVPSAMDQVEPGENGYVYSCGDVIGLRAALGKTLVSEARWTELGRRSRERITAEANHHAVAEGLIAALRSCRRERKGRVCR